MDLDCHARFTTDLMNELGGANASMLISPISIVFALSMAYAGAKGQTLQEFNRRFCINENTVTEFHQDLQDFIQHAKESKYPYISLFNRGYTQQDFEFNQDYLDNIQKTFNAQLQAVEFMKPGTADMINEAVAEVTDQNIKQIVSQYDFDVQTVMVLINTLLFKGSWETKFNKAEENTFWESKEVSRKIPMMNKLSDDFRYTENDHFRMVRIPFECPSDVWNMTCRANVKDHDNVKEVLKCYQRNRPVHTSFLVFLPKERYGLAEAMKHLDGDTIRKALKSHSSNTKVDLTLPTFTFEYEHNLVEPLKKMGLIEAFNETEANFSGINSKKQIYISDILHKTKIELTKNGIEAAAATSLMATQRLSNFIAPPPKIVEFKADYPFTYMIVDNSARILFSGIHN